ncbi:hypothetical protein [Roseisolibacter sp. H3M3-2]|uniref:hypothetical protein n=1 Tax=Roseisolibacter sp. H3M3-2 TaxID=3031323 RepID=UPI0023DB2BF2|nr:hypothetical protein [Roseisolibacter sp. H3M3-2]MDF1506196.1 hypothetical protein [Roseisolibacter sp. H3M3-2]
MTKRTPVPAGTAAVALAAAANTALPAAGDQSSSGPVNQDDQLEQDETANQPSGDVPARVILAFKGFEVNDLFYGDEEEIERLERAGLVDSHEDAVAYVRSLAE